MTSEEAKLFGQGLLCGILLILFLLAAFVAPLMAD